MRNEVKELENVLMTIPSFKEWANREGHTLCRDLYHDGTYLERAEKLGSVAVAYSNFFPVQGFSLEDVIIASLIHDSRCHAGDIGALAEYKAMEYGHQPYHISGERIAFLYNNRNAVWHHAEDWDGNRFTSEQLDGILYFTFCDLMSGNGYDFENSRDMLISVCEKADTPIANGIKNYLTAWKERGSIASVNRLCDNPSR